ncbi:MAG: cell wall-active antibiotics response protein [Deltaproteobacteria bacterium]|nr:cell wall-active antibiotics response protein [Deltaproteobacteria bacterium]
MNKNRHHRNSTGFWGVVLIVAGSLFFFENIGLFDTGELIGTFWPVVLIVVGIWIILKSNRKNAETVGPRQQTYCGDHETSFRSDTIAMSNLFGDVKVSMHSGNFQGGHVSTIFGDVVVDLSAIDMSSGEAELTLHNVFGDIKIIPPTRVAYAVRGSAVAGDIKIAGEAQSGFFPKLDYTSQGFDHAAKRIKIYVSHVFGDIKI